MNQYLLFLRKLWFHNIELLRQICLSKADISLTRRISYAFTEVQNVQSHFNTQITLHYRQHTVPYPLPLEIFDSNSGGIHPKTTLKSHCVESDDNIKYTAVFSNVWKYIYPFSVTLKKHIKLFLSIIFQNLVSRGTRAVYYTENLSSPIPTSH